MSQPETVPPKIPVPWWWAVLSMLGMAVAWVSIGGIEGYRGPFRIHPTMLAVAAFFGVAGAFLTAYRMRKYSRN